MWGGESARGMDVPDPLPGKCEGDRLDGLADELDAADDPPEMACTHVFL